MSQAATLRGVLEAHADAWYGCPRRGTIVVTADTPDRRYAFSAADQQRASLVEGVVRHLIPPGIQPCRCDGTPQYVRVEHVDGLAPTARRKLLALYSTRHTSSCGEYGCMWWADYVLGDGVTV